MTGPACGNNPNHQLTDGDRQAVDSFRAYLTARATLNRVRTVLETEAVVGRTALEYRGLIAAALMVDEPSLSPFYEHPECGFHWHGRDGMDVPTRDGQPVCPRCELAKAEKQMAALQRRRDEVGVECKRRGKRVLEQSEQILALERQIDEVHRQLGAEILRAGQAETALRRMADETQPAETPRPKREQIVYLSTPCVVCTHPFNWHVGGICQFDDEVNRCGCIAFATERQDGAQPS